MQVLEKQNNNNDLGIMSNLDIEKVMISKENYKKNKKSYSIEKAYKL